MSGNKRENDTKFPIHSPGGVVRIHCCFSFRASPMASVDSHLFKKKITRIFFLLSMLTIVVNSEQQCRNLESIISFGDSITDTGNLLHLSNPNDPPESAFPPYGETFFHTPTGRFSNGRLIIDFIAEFLGLPYVPPYFGSQNGSFEKGVNFAVGGATALEHSFLDKKGVHCDYTNISLRVQLKSFKESLPNLCGSPADCREMIGKSLIIIGEIGGNDYNYPFLLGKSIEETKELVPLVISTISSVVTEMINMGGRTIMVPSGFPIGCWPCFLTNYQTSNNEAYDPITGCLTLLNDFIKHQNKQLQAELNRLQKLYPHVTIVYADYYNIALQIFQEPEKYGFMNRPLSACCGSGGPYNFHAASTCGSKGVDCCLDPSKYVHWDGFHLTESAYRWIAVGLLEGTSYTSSALDWCCLSFELKNGSSVSRHSLTSS